MKANPSSTSFFRQSVPAIGLSIERATARTPTDTLYYVFLGEEIKGAFRSKKEALELYGSLLRASGYAPPRPEPSVARNEAVERYLDELETYWDSSHKHTRRGGKGRF